VIRKLVVVSRMLVVQLECWLVPESDRLRFERLEHRSPCPCGR